ncbi:MAG: hypothetical protein IJY04_00320 [Clostridia bacterium]|nr:hypothetical protein [Clostridia bacterium]
MNLDAYRAMVDENVVTPMIEYMDDMVDCDYTQRTIDKCESLLLDYIDALEALEDPSDEEIMQLVENLVLALNDLNESVNYALIETMERESICEIIQNSALDCGLNTTEDDITAEWREW